MRCGTIVRGLVALGLLATTSRARSKTISDTPFCPLEAFHSAHHAEAVGGDGELADLVSRLVDGENQCFSACIEAVRGHETLRAAELSRAQAKCRVCVDEEAEAQRLAVLQAMEEEQNAGCKVPEPSQDRCFVTPTQKYNVVDTRHRRAGLNGDGDTSQPTTYLGGWYGLPGEVRSGEDNGLSATVGGCSKVCMPSDGIGSIFSVVFSLYAAAFETGCSVVYPDIKRVAHGVKVDDLNDFFRASSNCLQGDRHEELEDLDQKVVGGHGHARHLDASGFDESDDAMAMNPLGTVYYLSRGEMCGPPAAHAFRLSHLRGGMHLCGRRHAGLLARLVLRAKFESGQSRLGARPPPPAFVAAVETKSATQLSQSAWFDPLGAGPDGRLQLNVVMHVRRGDVNLAPGKTHHSGGIYASHYVPLEVVTEALKVLMAAWGPLAEKLGLFFNIFVASEGSKEDFPTQEWTHLVGAHGQMHYKLVPYEGQKGSQHTAQVAKAENLTALDTVGQMMDTDILMADGKSYFSLAANAWAVNSLFLTYPWLLQLGAPLHDLLQEKNSTGVLAPEQLPKDVPLHPLYEKMVAEEAPGVKHPGVTLLSDAHRSEDFRSELGLLYEYRQHAVLQGLLANVVAKKRRALERGAHFNWVGY